LLLCCSAGYASAPAVQVGADFRRMSTDDCTSKAIDVMMDKQNFIQAEASDSYAWGYTENSLAIVHQCPSMMVFTSLSQFSARTLLRLSGSEMQSASTFLTA